MPYRSLAVLAACLAAGVSNAQTNKPADAAASGAKESASQPEAEPMYEAPDGTKLPVVKKSKVTISIDIEELRVGSGPECPPGATVMINYHGMLENGKVFDTTRGKKPVNFNLGQLILGWQLGIPGMKVGGVRRITIPYQLAYGDQEIPGPDGQPLIPAKSNLVFSIEMLAINGKDAEGNPYPPKEKALSRVEKDNGLIIEELRIGDGAECPPGATVVCHYRGVLAVDGQPFDSSYDRGQPATFPLSNVIKGWQEGIPGMKVGGKRRLIIPAELAYGAMARPGIPANSMLEFEVELVDIKN